MLCDRSASREGHCSLTRVVVPFLTSKLQVLLSQPRGTSIQASEEAPGEVQSRTKQHMCHVG